MDWGTVARRISLAQRPKAKCGTLGPPRMRERAVNLLNDEQCGMLILPPMCGPFNRLTWFIHLNMNTEQVEEQSRNGLVHFKFSMASARCRGQGAFPSV